MTWINSYWLWGLPVIWGLLGFAARSQQHSSGWQHWLEPHLLDALLEKRSETPRILQWPWLVGCILSLLVIALAGPSWQHREQPLLVPTSARVMLIDLSSSMLATDIAPSRIEWARQYLISRLDDGFAGETALIAFAGETYVVSPLTRDHKTLRRFIKALDPQQMPSDGSRLDLAIRQASDLLSTTPTGGGRILVISDGIETTALTREAAALARQANQALTVIATGTEQGAPLPDGKGGLRRDQNGQIIIAAADPESLRQLAESTGGLFLDNPDSPITLRESDWFEIDSSKPAAEDTNVSRSPENGGFWLLWLVLPCLILLFRPNALPVVLVFIGFGSGINEARAANWSSWWLNGDQQAWQALQANRPTDAATSAVDPLLQAYARYQMSDYRGVLELNGLERDADGLYLRGNSMVQLGLMKQALTSFQRAIDLRPDFSAARYNLALVRFYLDRQSAASNGDSEATGSAEDNSDILGQNNTQNSQSGSSVDNEESAGDRAGLGAGIVKELGRIPDEEIDAAVIEAELQQIIENLQNESKLPQQDQLERWAETLNSDLGDLFQRKFLRDYQRATGDR